MIFVGVDWAEAHHDVCVVDEGGSVLGRRRVTDGVAGVGELHALVAEYAEDPGEVGVGLELDRGLLVGALVAVGYEVYAVNPLAAARYRERHGVSGAKSDRGDAKVLADLVRTDRHNHRRIAGDSDLVEAIKVLAGPPVSDLVSAAPAQQPPLCVAGVLPRGPGRLRYRSGEQ
jgi:transposase